MESKKVGRGGPLSRQDLLFRQIGVWLSPRRNDPLFPFASLRPIRLCSGQA